jgi:lysophospholipase L1-like esterase
MNSGRALFAAFFHGSARSPIRRIGLVAAAVLASSGCDRLGLGDKSPTAPTGPPAAGSTIAYTAIGASDANGVGSSLPCVPFDQSCNGMGYVYVATRQLRTQGFTVSLTNLGLATAVIGRDFQTLGQQHGHTIVGNFIEQELPFVAASTTLVTVFSGVNEVNTITAALGGGAGGSDPNGFIDNQVRAYGADYATLLAGIRAKASSTRILILSVPNAAGLPYLAGASLAQRQAAQRAAVGMTRTVVNSFNSSAQNTIVIDLMCDSRSYLASNYSSDGLHPNDYGYAFMAAEVVRAATSTSYPAPQSSCAAMTIVP